MTVDFTPVDLEKKLFKKCAFLFCHLVWVILIRNIRLHTQHMIDFMLTSPLCPLATHHEVVDHHKARHGVDTGILGLFMDGWLWLGGFFWVGLILASLGWVMRGFGFVWVGFPVGLRWIALNSLGDPQARNVGAGGVDNKF